MVTTAKSRIDIDPVARTTERPASEVILPGHLLQLTSADNFQKNDDTSFNTLPVIALQRDFEGQGVNPGNASGEYSYVSGDQVVGGVFRPGDRVLLRVPASATAIVIGGTLKAATGGTVVNTTASTDVAIAIALEAVDNSGGGSEVYIKAQLV